MPLSASISGASTVAFLTSKPSEQLIGIGEPSKEVTEPNFSKSAFVSLPETT